MTIYAIDPGVYGGEPAPPDTEDVLSALSLDTGGVPAYRPATFGAAFDRIRLHASTYYVVAVDAGEGDRRSQTRRFNVRVTRQGVKVQGRSVVASAPPYPFRAEFAALTGVPESLRPVLEAPIPPNALDVRGQAVVVRGDREASKNGASAVVIIELAGEALHLNIDTALHLAAVAVDRAGRPTGYQARTVALRSAFAPGAPLRERGVRLMLRLPLDAETAEVRAAAGYPGSSNVRSLTIPVNVPAFDESPLTLSGLLLSNPEAADTPTVGRDSIVEEALEAQVSLARVLPRTDVLSWAAEVYQPRDGEWQPVDISASVEDGAGREVLECQASLPARGEGEDKPHRVTGRVKLADLVPGDYMLRVRARLASGTRKGESVRAVPFSVR